MTSSATRPQIRGVLNDIRRVQGEERLLAITQRVTPELPSIGSALANITMVALYKKRLAGLLEADRSKLKSVDLDTVLVERLKNAASRSDVRRMSARDYSITFRHIGLGKAESEMLAGRVLDAISNGRTIRETEDVLYTNRCSLDPQDLLRGGLRLKEYAIENGELSIVAMK